MSPGGSGKRSLPMVLAVCVRAIGKLRRLRLPLPPETIALQSLNRIKSVIDPQAHSELQS